MKIHCIEMKKKGFDEKNFKELREMVGWIEAPDKDGDWDVTTADGSGFSCKTQIEAQILANIEEVKAMLIEVRLKKVGEEE